MERSILLDDRSGASATRRRFDNANAVTGLAFSPDGSLLASVLRDGTLTLHDPSTLQPLARARNAGSKKPTVTFDRQGKHVIAVDPSSVRIFAIPPKPASD